MGGFIQKTGFPFEPGINFSEIIDVRAPSEFAEDHISGAINLPVLNDAERIEIGTIYKQESPFIARKLGAAIVSRNISEHINRHFIDREKDYRPLIHCWRGGQRSESMATVLSSIGWHVYFLEGGYRTYRRYVITEIESRVSRLNFVVLNGLTGAGKTLVLKKLHELGEQVLDLEGLACHKGSVFGGDPHNPQPAQKRFESLLFNEFNRFDDDRPVYIEAESAKIGKLNLPNPLWQKMKVSPVIELNSPLECRAEYLTEDYNEWLSDLDRVLETIDRLKGFHPNKQLVEWKQMAKNRNWKDLTASLLAEHYDRRYRPANAEGNFQSPCRKLVITNHDDSSLQTCAEQVRGFEIKA
ncbi:MAG: tRNA 2-selenouridine(34) synthase MnmH [Verrucomicrobiales bacterium]|nr:tRNA 2-selenouridine(34) synthase MnmH [Verrucomicrobiales bacterium]